jgi:hypothetical protein
VVLSGGEQSARSDASRPHTDRSRATDAAASTDSVRKRPIAWVVPTGRSAPPPSECFDDKFVGGLSIRPYEDGSAVELSRMLLASDVLASVNEYAREPRRQ